MPMWLLHSSNRSTWWILPSYPHHVAMDIMTHDVWCQIRRRWCWEASSKGRLNVPKWNFYWVKQPTLLRSHLLCFVLIIVMVGERWVVVKFQHSKFGLDHTHRLLACNQTMLVKWIDPSLFLNLTTIYYN